MLHVSAFRRVTVAAAAALLFFMPSSAQAQAAQPRPAPVQPPPPPPLWAGSIGAGLAVTSGNTDTSTINLAYEIKRDGGRRIIFKSAGLYLRGETDDELSVDRAFLENRGEYRLTDRLSTFGQVSYLRDRFKEIEYLVTPTGGLSYAFIRTPRLELSGDGSLGIVWEKNTDFDLETDGAVLGGEKLTITLSDTARITQAVTGLWKMDDFADSIFTFSAGVASSLTSRSELKAELLDTYKRRPPNPTVQSNDLSMLLSFVYKL